MFEYDKERKALGGERGPRRGGWGGAGEGNAGLEVRSVQRAGSRAPLGDSSKSWTAAGAACVCVNICMCVCTCVANSEQKTFFVALRDNKRIQK